MKSLSDIRSLDQSKEQIDISVILPCYNTSGTLEDLSKRLIKVLEEESRTFEIIMVYNAPFFQDH